MNYVDLRSTPSSYNSTDYIGPVHMEQVRDTLSLSGEIRGETISPLSQPLTTLHLTSIIHRCISRTQPHHIQTLPLSSVVTL